uniref:Uncharacterized protein n=1 Tax=Triticum urartu TaxID=4572 RepID=A0A8R7PBV2_TRIUA
LASIASRLCSCKGLELANAAGHGDQGGTFAAGDDGGGVQGVAEAVRRGRRRPDQQGRAPRGHPPPRRLVHHPQGRPRRPPRRQGQQRLHRRRRGGEPRRLRAEGSRHEDLCLVAACLGWLHGFFYLGLLNENYSICFKI